MAQNANYVHEFDSEARLTFPTQSVSPNLICPVEILQVFSPLDFYVRHLCFAETIVIMEQNMQLYYSDEAQPLNERVPDSELRQSACVAKNCDDKFHRGKILEIGDREALLFFVDSGVTKYVKWNDIKPLSSTFAELPSLAVKCRLRDVDSRELEYWRIDKFRKLMSDYQSTNTQIYADFNPLQSQDVYDINLYLRTEESDDNYYSLHEEILKLMNFTNQNGRNEAVENGRKDQATVEDENLSDGDL